MRHVRSYVDMPLAVGAEIELGEQASIHLVRVLRRKPGDPCTVFNGDGHDYAAQLVSVGRKTARVRIGGAHPVANESTRRIVLAQGLARGEKMDWVLQKATELGVHAVAPVITQRTEVRLGAERAERRMAHWRGVVIAACEQCGRARLPELAEPVALADHAATPAAGRLRLFLDPEAETRPAELDPAAGQDLELVVGPEGGLSDSDLALLRAAGYRGLRLGPRVLRTETAGLAALAVLQARWGDLD